MKYPTCHILVTILLVLLGADLSRADVAGAFDIGTPDVRDVWVDPVSGSDSNSGTSRENALRTVTAAWQGIPSNATLTRGVRINLLSGVFPRSSLPHYWENRRGSYQHPIIFRAADGEGTVTFEGDMNMFGVSYLYLIGFRIIPLLAGDVLHFEQCDHILVRRMVLSGAA